jgi:hypothetical protein
MNHKLDIYCGLIWTPTTSTHAHFAAKSSPTVVLHKKKRKISALIYFSSCEISFLRLFRGTKKNEKKILPGFVKHTLV